MKLQKKVILKERFSDEGVDGYQLDGGDFLNEYYLVSHEASRRLLQHPEVVGYEVYKCMLKATSRMLRYLKEAGKIRSANILSILRGALNYPLEESCYQEGIRVHDISFLSSERVFDHESIAGLEIKYNKLAMVPDSTLLIGDIIATGDTLAHCLQYVIDWYSQHGEALRNIIVFTVGGSRGIELMEALTQKIRKSWPDFQGFVAIYYEGIFNTYTEKGVSGVNLPDVDFYWKDGIVCPEYRHEVLSSPNTLFEKCTIYDGGARRYEIQDHIAEVLEYWQKIEEYSDRIDLKKLADEKLGYDTPVSLEQWVEYNHYEAMDPSLCVRLYQQEREYLKRLESLSLKDIARERIEQFSAALKDYME